MLGWGYCRTTGDLFQSQVHWALVCRVASLCGLEARLCPKVLRVQRHWLSEGHRCQVLMGCMSCVDMCGWITRRIGAPDSKMKPKILLTLRLLDITCEFLVAVVARPHFLPTTSGRAQTVGAIVCSLWLGQLENTTHWHSTLSSLGSAARAARIIDCVPCYWVPKPWVVDGRQLKGTSHRWGFEPLADA